jgi:hypothetical protein
MAIMETSQFIDQLSAGNASEAKDTLNNLLSARAFESLDAKKVELAKNIFNGSQVEEPQEEELELSQEEYDQLDELSKATVKGYLKGVKKENDPRIHGDSAGPANQMSDKARSLGRTEQDKEDSRYQGKKTAIAKLGGSKSVLPSKVPAK